MTELEDLKEQNRTLESMLSLASATIARLEGRWRSPESASLGQEAIVIESGSLTACVARLKSDGFWYACKGGAPVNILAWHELPALPSIDGYGDLI